MRFAPPWSWEGQRVNKAGPGCWEEGWAVGRHLEHLKEWEWQIGADVVSARFPSYSWQISPLLGLSKLCRMAHGIALANEPQPESLSGPAASYPLAHGQGWGYGGGSGGWRNAALGGSLQVCRRVGAGEARGRSGWLWHQQCLGLRTL